MTVCFVKVSRKVSVADSCLLKAHVIWSGWPRIISLLWTHISRWRSLITSTKFFQCSDVPSHSQALFTLKRRGLHRACTKRQESQGSSENSACHSLPSGPQQFPTFPYAKYIHTFPRCPRVSAHYSMSSKSKFSSAKSPKSKSGAGTMWLLGVIQ